MLISFLKSYSCQSFLFTITKSNQCKHKWLYDGQENERIGVYSYGLENQNWLYNGSWREKL